MTRRTAAAPNLPRTVALAWHREADAVLALGEPPLLLIVGEPGVGKTTYARTAALAATGREPLALSGSPEVDQSHFFGRWTLANGETRFVDGPLPAALKGERWLVVEEFSQIPIDVRACLMPLRDQAALTNPFTGEVLPVPPGFRLIATSNTETLTCRKNGGVAKVLYDGFYILEAPDLADAQVADMLRARFPKLAAARLKRVLALWNEYRDFSSKGSTGKSYLSYRAAEHLARLLEAGLAEDRAVRIALINKFLPADDELYKAAVFKAGMATPAGDSESGGNADPDTETDATY